MTKELRTRSEKNQAMECFRLLAAVLVVFLHVPFPGRVGSAVCALARIAVPGFFAISGYFSFQISGERLKKRALRMGKLYLTAVILAFVLGTGAALGRGESLADFALRYVPDSRNLWAAVLVQESCFPDTGYGWYLLSGLVCYLVLWGYVSFFPQGKIRYQPLYLFAACMLCIHLLLGEAALLFDVWVPYQLCRNGLLFGLPMTCLGLFLREYGQRLRECFCITRKKLGGLFALGVALTLLQWKAAGVGELPPGAVVQVAALLMLLEDGAALCIPWGEKLGSVSLAVYLLHYPLIGLYETFFLPVLPLETGVESWLRPIMIVCASIAAGAAWAVVSPRLKKKKG